MSFTTNNLRSHTLPFLQNLTGNIGQPCSQDGTTQGMNTSRQGSLRASKRLGITFIMPLYHKGNRHFLNKECDQSSGPWKGIFPIIKFVFFVTFDLWDIVSVNNCYKSYQLWAQWEKLPSRGLLRHRARPSSLLFLAVHSLMCSCVYYCTIPSIQT